VSECGLNGEDDLNQPEQGPSFTFLAPNTTLKEQRANWDKKQKYIIPGVQLTSEAVVSRIYGAGSSDI
jgi:hypothetical protein